MRGEDRRAIGTDAEEHRASHGDQVGVAREDVGTKRSQRVDDDKREDVQHVATGHQRRQHEGQHEQHRAEPGVCVKDFGHGGSLDLLDLGASQQTVGTEDQDGQHHDEGHGVLPGRGHIGACEV